jgi:hypothetical protein
MHLTKISRNRETRRNTNTGAITKNRKKPRPSKALKYCITAFSKETWKGMQQQQLHSQSSVPYPERKNILKNIQDTFYLYPPLNPKSPMCSIFVRCSKQNFASADFFPPSFQRRWIDGPRHMASAGTSYQLSKLF